MPKPEGTGRLGFHLVVGAHLPGAVIDVHQAVHHRRRRAARHTDLRSGHDTALQAAGVDGDGPPLAGNALGEGLSLCDPGRSQRKLGAIAEADRIDARDMAATGEEEASRAS